MKVKDLIKDDIQSASWWVNDYVVSNMNFEIDEVEQVLNLNKILRNVYISTCFLDDVNNGGLDYYYDCSSGKFKDYLLEIFEEFDCGEMCEIIQKGNDIISKVEERIGESITDNIQEIDDEESEEIQKLTYQINDLNENDRLYDYISAYVLKNLDSDI